MESQIHQVKQNTQVNNLLKHKVLGDNVLILPFEFEGDDTVINPRQYEDKQEIGIVMAVGTGETEIKVGDVVVFGRYASTTVRSHGVDFFFVRSEDIWSKYAG